MRFRLLVNPSAGRGRAVDAADRAARRLAAAGAAVETIRTGSFEETVDAAARAEADAGDVLVAVGGDGTVHAVVNGLLRRPPRRRPRLGVVPSGRGDDFAASLGLADVDDAVGTLLDGEDTWIDLGKADEAVFVGVAGAGFDARVARRAREGVPWLPGGLVYLYAVLRTLTELRPLDARVRYEGGVYEGPLTFVAVGNNDRYGAGMRIAPAARLDDGLLDLCLVERISRTTLVRMLPTVFRGTHVRDRRVRYLRTPWVEIEASEPAELFADGEPVQRLPARIEALPRALAVRSPRRARRPAVPPPLGGGEG